MEKEIDMEKYANFTPNVPIIFEGTKAIQVVDGEKNVLHPSDVADILTWREQGMSDQDIHDWLDML